MASTRPKCFLQNELCWQILHTAQLYVIKGNLGGLALPKLLHLSSYRFCVHADALKENLGALALPRPLHLSSYRFCVNTDAVKENLGGLALPSLLYWSPYRLLSVSILWRRCTWVTAEEPKNKRSRGMSLFQGSLDRPQLRFRKLKVLVYTVGIKELWIRN